MKADITRSTFDPANHYTGVRMQQGRVQLDADWNEHEDIFRHRIETGTTDAVGTGAPHDNAGFRIYTQGADLRVGAGRYYVDGVLCENDEDVLITAQPDNPGPELPVAPGQYIFYLDVWTRHLTALDDPRIREQALGGPDTATRLLTVWQVRFMNAGQTEPKFECLARPQAWDDLHVASTARLRARARPAEDDETPCIVPAAAGYRRLENQLYRVEIHDPGGVDEATFKWSRDNGSIVVSWIGPEPGAAPDEEPDTLVVEGAPQDRYLGFAAGQWVELTDEASDLAGRPGTMVMLTAVDGNTLTISPESATGSRRRDRFIRSPKVRRWDGGPATAEISDDDDGYIALESGVEVRFEEGAEYRTGDYWLIPARVNDGTIDWPDERDLEELGDAEEGDVGDVVPTIPVALPPAGIRHAYARLAVAERNAAGWRIVSDCRAIFPAATDLRNLHYVGGDGQEAMPNPQQLGARLHLDRQLQVGVSNGRWPVANARVRFTVRTGAGFVQGAAGPAIIDTGADGVASCTWEIDSMNPSQQVEAVLLDAPGVATHLPVIFNAHLSTAARVAYAPGACAGLAGVTTVQDALDRLCAAERGSGCCTTVGEDGKFRTLEEAIAKLLGGDGRAGDICICLLPGSHQVRQELMIRGAGGGTNVHIHGCGPATRVILVGARIEAHDLASLTLHALSLEVGGRPVANPLVLSDCREVRITECSLSQTTNITPLLSIAGAERITIADSRLESPYHAQLRLADSGVFAREVPDWTVIQREIAQRLFENPQLIDRFIERYVQFAATLPAAPRHALDASIARLRAEAAPVLAAPRVRTPAGILGALAAFYFVPALGISDRPVMTAIRNSTIVGDIYIYGSTGPALLDQEYVRAITGIAGLATVAADLQISHSQLTRVLVDRSAFGAVNAEVLSRVFSRWALTDNLFASPGTQVLAGHVAITGNYFPTATDSAAAIVRGRSAIVVGNAAANDKALLSYRVPPLGFQAAANVLTMQVL